jgi:hypothetical protein
MGRRPPTAAQVAARKPPPQPLLVRDAPQLVRRDTLLTDGSSAYRVVNHHRRHGRDHFHLVNVEQPERHGWFSITDMGELAFAKGERRQAREEFGS